MKTLLIFQLLALIALEHAVTAKPFSWTLESLMRAILQVQEIETDVDNVEMQQRQGMTILDASYGGNCANLASDFDQDRTFRWVRDLCRGKTRCSGVVHTSILGDPNPRCIKSFRARARCPNGKTIENFIPGEAEGRFFTLDCTQSDQITPEPNTGIKVSFAYYGENCAEQKGKEINEQARDRTISWVQDQCRGRTKCSGVVHSSVLGDLYPGCKKSFSVVAECPDGQPVTDFVTAEAEGRPFSLNCELTDLVFPNPTLKPNTGMRISFAYYGKNCARESGNPTSNFVRDRTTSWVQDQCRDRTSCSAVVHTSVLGDPYPDCDKDFWAIAECPDGQTITDFIPAEAEGRPFSLTCPQKDLVMFEQYTGMRISFAYYGHNCAKKTGNPISNFVRDRTTRWVKDQCHDRTRCSAVVHTSVLGDPYPDCDKDFRVIATCPDGQTITDFLPAEAEGNPFSLTCPQDQILPEPITGIHITFAYYGGNCAKDLERNNRNRIRNNQNRNRSNQIRDSTQEETVSWVQDLCRGRTRCSGVVHTSVLGDPYPGCKKSFSVIGECPDGHTVTDFIAGEAQGRSFSLDCQFTG